MSPGRARIQSLILGAIGIGLFLFGWEMIGAYKLAGLTWPRFTTVIDYLFEPSRAPLFRRAMTATFSMIGLGYGIGFLAGLGMAALVYVLPPLRPGMDRLSSVVHAIPAIALAPIFIVLVDRDLTGCAIAALNVYFVIYVATTSGLAASSRNHRDLMTVLGAGKPRQLRLLEIPAALPDIVSGAKYAVPASFIGAILGEWFGASRGLGLLMVSAMQNFQIPLLWSAVLIASSASLLCFGALSLLERAVYARYR